MWASPHSGATYPAGWHVEVPSTGLALDIQPLVADQELNVSLTYWEGAVRISGVQNGKPISGYGYVELTGYAGSVRGQF
jgi:predicted secreted hydrolase